jgi:hypothetical protein
MDLAHLVSAVGGALVSAAAIVAIALFSALHRTVRHMAVAHYAPQIHV